MRKFYYKVPKNKRDALRFVYFLDSEWDKCFKIGIKRDRCKAILKVQRTAVDCMEKMKSQEQCFDLKKAISILEKWLRMHRLSDV